MPDKRLDTHHKALGINQDPARYGTFAEIGAGQETARWFFHVGGASATVAKTMSAYDMAVSDAVYGPVQRYVSRQRLQSMLDYEYELLRTRLEATRGGRTAFFVFADTVTTGAQGRSRSGHGWLGIRYQPWPGAEPCQIIIHARMWDSLHLRQREALGILGVNLIHAAFYLGERSHEIVSVLMDDLTRDRMEVDMIEFSGPLFAGIDNRLISLDLVQKRLTNAVVFPSAGGVVEPSELLYQKPVLIERGRFRPVTRISLDLLEAARRQMREEQGREASEPVSLMELTLRSLSAGGEVIDHRDFLARVDTLRILGRTVMVSNYSRYHTMVGYLRRYTARRVALVLGVPTLSQVLDEKHYQDVDGGLLEALGRIFQGDVRLYIYPWRNPATGELVTADNFDAGPRHRHLYAHLRSNDFIIPLCGFHLGDQPVLPGEVLRWIQQGNPAWESAVPEPVVAEIKSKRLFGYPGDAGNESA